MSNNIQYPNRLLNKEGLSYLWTKIKSALSGKADKAPNAVSGNFAMLDSNGNLKDSGHKHSDYEEAISTKADKEDTVLLTTLSRGRATDTTIGIGSFAFGNNVTAFGEYSHAEGINTIASGDYSHAEGNNTSASGNHSHTEGEGTSALGYHSHAEGYFSTASGDISHAEGRQTTSSGVGAHSEGKSTNAAGNYSHAEGEQTTAYAQASHVVGRYNSTDTYVNWNNWVSGTEYAIGDKVQRMENNKRTGYICKTANSDVDFDSSKWDKDTLMNYVEIVGNGKNTNNKSNARAVDWDGNEYLRGNLKVFCNSDSTSGLNVANMSHITSLENNIENINSSMAIVQSDDAATVNISAGQYVCWYGRLHKASVAITTGETFTPGNLAIVENGGFNDLSKVTTWSGSGLTITRCGNVCQVVVGVSKTASTWSNVYVCTVPQGFRPRAQIKFAVFGDANYNVGFEINTNGGAYICARGNALTTSWYWYGGTSYICTE